MIPDMREKTLDFFCVSLRCLLIWPKIGTYPCYDCRCICGWLHTRWTPKAGSARAAEPLKPSSEWTGQRPLFHGWKVSPINNFQLTLKECSLSSHINKLTCISIPTLGSSVNSAYIMMAVWSHMTMFYQLLTLP